MSSSDRESSGSRESAAPTHMKHFLGLFFWLFTRTDYHAASRPLKFDGHEMNEDRVPGLSSLRC